MAISLIQPTKIIFVPKADTTLVSSSPDIRSLDMDFFHNELRTQHAQVANSVYEQTHDHVTVFNIGTLTLQRVVRILPPWFVEFEDTGTPYAVRLIGGNNNIEDRTVVNNVSVRPSNSAGAIQVSTGSGLDAGQDAKITRIHELLDVVEGTLDHQEVMRVLLAAAAGKLSGAAGTSIAVRDQADSKNRIQATVDADGNRTAVSIDAT